MSFFTTIREILSPITEPIKTIFRPLDPYLRPLAVRWQNFATDNPRLSFLIKLFGSITSAILGFILLVMFLIWLGFLGGLPSKKDLKMMQNDTASEVYSSDGVLLGRYYVQNRTETTYQDISPNILNALIATEDARFFDHRGIDLVSWGRVFWKTIVLRQRSGGGGSTLSQQLAKNLFPRQKYWVLGLPINKIREWMIAGKLENLYNKEELITMYLNTVPFSDNVFGVEVASRRFFNTTPKEVTPNQAAVLIGMLKATTLYSPTKNPDRSLKRRNTVLGLMQKNNYITEDEFKKYSKQPLGLKITKESISDGQATYFREFLRQELDNALKDYKKPNGQPYNIYRDGLRIYTTIDSKMQNYAEQAVKEHMIKAQKSFENDWKHAKPGSRPWENDTILCAEFQKYKQYAPIVKGKVALDKKAKATLGIKVPMKIYDWRTCNELDTVMSPLDSVKYYFKMLNAGFMAMEPQSGAIKAWVGGIDYRYFKYDHVRSRRQVGSTFKPVLYSRALQAGISPCQYWGNYVRTYHEFEDWRPENSEGERGGSYSMEGAITESLNVIAAQVIMKAGINETAELGQKMGITSKIPRVPAISLGTVDASLFDMSKVFGVFPNRGVRPAPRFLEKVTNSNGDVIATFEQTPKEKLERVLNEEEADIMVHMLRAVVEHGTGSRMRSRYDLRNELGGKTGTTQSQADGWFICFSPTLVTGTWVGAETPQSHFRTLDNGQGASSALPICGIFLKKLYADDNFKKISKETFPKMSANAQAKLACAKYLPAQRKLDSLDIYNLRHDTLGRPLRALEPAPINTDEIKEDIN